MTRLASGKTWSGVVVATCLLVLCATVVAGEDVGKKKIAGSSGVSVASSFGGPVTMTSAILVKQAVPATSETNPKQRPTKPQRLPQVSEEEFATVAVGASTAGDTAPALGAGGRKLKALGDRCSVNIKNLCKSRKTFQVSFGYYTKNGVDSGYLRGWEAQGWYSIKYGQTLTLNGFKTLYVRFSNNQRLTSTVGGPAAFCASSKPYQILEATDGYFYYGQGNYYYRVTSCAKAGGTFLGGWYAPSYCARTYVSTAC